MSADQAAPVVKLWEWYSGSSSLSKKHKTFRELPPPSYRLQVRLELEQKRAPADVAEVFAQVWD